MDRWAGKVVLVTDANADIGQSIVRMLAKNGMIVVAVGKRFDKLETLATTINTEFTFYVYPAQCDIQTEKDIVQVFLWAKVQLGGVDVLVNNSIVPCTGTIIEGSTTTYRNIMDTNVIATASCSRELIKSVKEQNTSGHIINISSIVSHDAKTSNVPLSLYTASKCAINGMASSLRTELTNANLDIKVTNISHGTVMDTLNDYSEAKDTILPVLDAECIADTVLYVLSMPQHVEICDINITPHNVSSNISPNLEVK